MEDALVSFVEKWSLDSASQDMLAQLSEGLLEDVLSSFDPPPDTRNMNAKLKTFVRSKQDGGGPKGGQKGGQKGKGHAKGGDVAPPWRSNAVDPIGQFAKTWQLDERNVQLLKELPHEACARVIADFDPPGDTQNVNAKLHSFVRNRLKDTGQHQVQQASFDPVTSFVGHWGFDAASEAMLRSLSPELLQTCLEEFDPPPDTQNPSGKLTAFVKAIRNGGGSRASQAGYGGGGYRQQEQQQYQDPVTEFVAYWGLDGQAEQAVRAIPVDLQERVLAEFSPPEDTQNPSGKLTAFIRAVMNDDGSGKGKGKDKGKGGGSFDKGGGSFGKGGGGAVKRKHADPVSGFIMQWQLDEQAEQLLHSLPWDIQEGIINEFHPPPGTMNFSGKFHSFVKKRLEESGVPMPAKGSGKKGRSDSDPAGGLGGGGSHQPRRPRASGDPIGDFVHQWGLDASSDAMLRSLSKDILEEVLAKFEPQAGTRNPNAKLATWVRSIREGAAPPKRARHE